MEAMVAEKRRELIEIVSEVDDKLAEAFLNDEPISSADLEVCSGLMISLYCPSIVSFEFLRWHREIVWLP